MAPDNQVLSVNVRLDCKFAKVVGLDKMSVAFFNYGFHHITSKMVLSSSDKELIAICFTEKY